MKIIIGVDDSPHSEAALEFVKKMTWPTGTEVIVVSAVRPAVVMYTEMYVPAPTQIDQLMAEQHKIHEELVARAAQQLRDGGFKITTMVLVGDPREAILNMAKSKGADLIVVGSHGRSGIAKLLMGSVASHVVTHAPCNVVVVRPRAVTQ